MPRRWPPKPPPPKGPNEGHWRAGRKFPWWKKENMVWSRRKKTGIRQKPWNKVTRMEKFWTSPVSVAGSTSFRLINNVAQNICTLVGNELAADDALGTVNLRGIQHVKVHRCQGAIWAWLDPTARMNFAALGRMADNAPAYPEGAAITPSVGIEVPANVQMLTYAWRKVKMTADTYTGAQPITPSGMLIDPAVPNGDFQNMLNMDDIISWGSVPIWGIVPRMFSIQAATGLSGTMQVGLPGQFMQGHISKIPLPRIPKMGLNLKHGEALACFAVGWPGPGDFTPDVAESQQVRDIIVFPSFRILASL